MSIFLSMKNSFFPLLFNLLALDGCTDVRNPTRGDSSLTRSGELFLLVQIKDSGVEDKTSPILAVKVFFGVH